MAIFKERVGYFSGENSLFCGRELAITGENWLFGRRELVDLRVRIIYFCGRELAILREKHSLFLRKRNNYFTRFALFCRGKLAHLHVRIFFCYPSYIYTGRQDPGTVWGACPMFRSAPYCSSHNWR